MKKIGQFAIAATMVAAVISASAAPLPVNLSGYEFLLGTSCTINGQAATCGVAFGGWTGGHGPVATGGWTPFPGNDEGLWKATIEYVGKAEFGSHVEVAGGSFDVLFRNGTTVTGKVTGGSVMWPPAGHNTGCGTDVAVVSVNVAFRGAVTGSGLFRGCLHDLPAGSVIPPKIWGSLE